MTYLFLRLLKDDLKEYTYAARLAGLVYGVASGMNAILVSKLAAVWRSECAQEEGFGLVELVWLPTFCLVHFSVVLLTHLPNPNRLYCHMFKCTNKILQTPILWRSFRLKTPFMRLMVLEKEIDGNKKRQKTRQLKGHWAAASIKKTLLNIWNFCQEFWTSSESYRLSYWFGNLDIKVKETHYKIPSGLLDSYLKISIFSEKQKLNDQVLWDLTFRFLNICMHHSIVMGLIKD